MKIGTIITLEVIDLDTNEIRKCRTKIIEKNMNYLFIDYPVDINTEKTVFLKKNTPINVQYVAENQSVYQFHSRIVAKVNVNVPALTIQMPEANRIKRIQRREYVRIRTTVDVAVHSENDSFVPFQTVTADISGGGMSIILPKSKQLAAQDMLNVWIVLPMHSGEYVYIVAQTIVIRTDVGNDQVNTASLNFTAITDHDRQQIIRFCFEKQREARNKELL